MAIYSFCGTPIQIEISDQNARIFNNVAQNVSIDNTSRYIQFHGSKDDVLVFNKVSTVINLMIDLNEEDLPYSEELWPLRLIKVGA